MKRILIIHPEGNISNNLNLYAIVSKLCGKGYKIDYLAWKRNEVPQRSYFNGMRFFKARHDRYSKYSIFSRMLRSKIELPEKIFFRAKRYSFIIGIDEGVVCASKIYEETGIPFGLISYEIYPYDEVDNKIEKELEIQSCKNIKFAIAQDDERARLLSLENQISIEKIIKIPLGGLESKKLEKDYCLHEKLGIEKNRKIAIVMGSLAEWSMIDKIIEDMVFWNEEWVLVIHGRYLQDDFVKYIKDKNKDNEKIYFSETPVETCEEIYTVLSSVSLGFAFYKPTYKSKWSGLNLDKIGMSSGKIATFLRHGIPIITNQIGEMSKYVNEFSLGRVVSGNEKIILNFSKKELDEMSEKCTNFYNDRLWIEKNWTDFFEKIKCY